MTEPEVADQELIQLIAEQQDQQAFACLFDRYKRPGYRLALYITHDSESAEEALQEAMITVWRSAGAYNGSGKVEAWIMRIVSHAALQQIRKRKQKKTQQMANNDQQCDSPLPQVRLADTEMVLLLRKALVALSAPDRQLIALRFAAGMTQVEISEELRIPQQTVSYRIESIVKHLRSVLPNVELSAVLLAEGLREAIFNGTATPKGDFTEIARSISKPRKSVFRRPPKPSQASLAGKFAISATILAATGVTTLVMLQSKPAPAPVAPTPVVKVPAPQPAPVEPKFAYSWNFEAGIPSDLKVLGAQEWDKGQKALIANPVNAILFPFSFPARPVKVICELNWDQKGDYGCTVNASELKPLANGDFKVVHVKQMWNSHTSDNILLSSTIPSGESSSPGHKTFVAYLWDDHVVEFYDKSIARVADLEDPLSGKGLWLKFNHASLLSIKVEAINEVPAELRDFKKLTAGLIAHGMPDMKASDKSQ